MKIGVGHCQRVNVEFLTGEIPSFVFLAAAVMFIRTLCDLEVDFIAGNFWAKEFKKTVFSG